MKFYCLFVSLFLSVLCHSAHAQLTQEEKAELKTWGRKFMHSSGALLTPPRGSIDKNVAETRRYTEEMLEELAGKELREKGIEVVVNLYSGATINAFALENSVAFDDSPEKKWKENHPTEMWPIRRLLGKTDEGKPIYEIGIQLGLYRKFKTEAEFAFVLAHEVAHLLEGHTHNPHEMRDKIRKWWGGQRHEAAADLRAIELMLAKYDLDGALMAIERLARESKLDTRGMAADDYGYLLLRTALGTHHHMGVRIAMLQAFIEYLRHTDPRSEKLELTNLPAFTQINKPPRVHLINEDFENSQRELKRFVREQIVGGIPLLLTAPELQNYYEDPTRFDFELPEVVEKFKRGSFLGGTGEHQLSRSFYECFEIVRDGGLGKQDSIEAFLKLAQLFRKTELKMPGRSRGEGGEISYWSHLTDEQTQEISRFWVRNLSGPESFTWKEFVRRWRHVAPERVLIQSFAHLMLTDRVSQSIMAKLYRAPGKWNTDIRMLVDSIAKTKYGRGRSQKRLRAFSYYLFTLSYENFYQGDLLEIMREKALDLAARKYVPNLMRRLEKGGIEFLSFYKQMLSGNYHEHEAYLERYDTLEAEKEGNSFYARLAQHGKIDVAKTRESDLRFLSRMKEILRPVHELFERRRKELLVTELKKRPFERKRTSRIFGTLMSYEHSENAELLPQAEEDLLSLVRHSLYREHPGAVGSQMEKFLLGVMTGNYPAETKKEAFLLLSSSLQFDTGITGEREKREEVTRLLEVYLETLSPSELIELRKIGISSATEEADQIDRILRGRKNRKLLEEHADRIHNLGGAEIAGSFGVLNLIGASQKTAERFADAISVEEFRSLVRDLDQARLKYAERDSYFTLKVRADPGEPFPKLEPGDLSASQSHLAAEGANLLYRSFVAIQGQIQDFERWLQLLDKVIKAGPYYFEPSFEIKDAIESEYVRRLSEMSPQRAYRFARRKEALSLIRAENIAEIYVRHLEHALQGSRKAEHVKEHVDRIVEQVNLKGKHPELFVLFRDRLTEKLSLQPADILTIFPEDTRSVTDRTAEFSTEIRGASLIAQATQDRSFKEQIELIEYLMGRSREIPDFIRNRKEDIAGIQLGTLARNLRSRLSRETVESRVLLVNGVLAGVDGMVASAKGRAALVDHMLSSVDGENKELAKEMADALLESRPHSQSLAIAYVLGQKSKKENRALGEAEILSSLLSAFGVPGIKLGQYLAYTNEFKQYSAAFASYQDQANPVSYFAALKVINERFKGRWPPGLRIIRLLGFGSVNLAVQYYNPLTKQNEVLQIGREDIVSSTKEHFRRFNQFLEKLTDTAKGKERYGFLLGLSKIIERSVELEFDKTAALRMQKSVQELYNGRVVNGWNIKTVNGFHQENLSIFMEMAEGKTARKIFESNPDLYRDAMRAMGQVEYEVLLGMGKSGRPNPVPLHANPDFHDGQVLIDEETRTITILDFGQAVKITNRERELGIDILRIASNRESVDTYLEIVNQRAREYMGIRHDLLERSELKSILKSNARMDIFVHLISKLSEKGFEVPLSSIHWVLGMNRQIVLGEKIGVDVERKVRNLVITRKVTGGLAPYNTGYSVWKKIKEGVRQILGLSPPHATATQAHNYEVASSDSKL